ncbi:hypothetical protein N2152v2_003420 [Parachlorella kessleri]
MSTVCASGGGADGAPEGSSGGGPNSGIALTIAAAGVAGGLLLPAAALATPTDDVHSMYLLSVGLGAAFTLITLLSTSRFIMSYFPRLVRKAGRGRTLWRVFTVFDPVLQPVQTRLFRMEPGDLDYSAMLLLAVVCAMLEGLVGDGGLLVEKVPDLQLLGYLQASGSGPGRPQVDSSAVGSKGYISGCDRGVHGDGRPSRNVLEELQASGQRRRGQLGALVAFQHGLLLPSWAMVVGRFFAFL